MKIKTLKKIILILLLAAMIFLLAGCADKVVGTDGVERACMYGFVILERINEYSYVCYDRNTSVCYCILTCSPQIALSPYYIIGDNGQPEIAVYGQNYFGGQVQ